MSNLQTLESIVLNKHVLLHGGPGRYTELLPFLTDGEKAICATQFPEIAVFMAIFKSYPVGGARHFGVQFHSSADGVQATFRWKLNPNFMEHPLKGYVYVVEKEGFTKKFNSEFRTYHAVNFLSYHEVTKDDLPFVINTHEETHTVKLNSEVFNAVI